MNLFAALRRYSSHAFDSPARHGGAPLEHSVEKAVEPASVASRPPAPAPLPDDVRFTAEVGEYVVRDLRLAHESSGLIRCGEPFYLVMSLGVAAGSRPGLFRVDVRLRGPLEPDGSHPVIPSDPTLAIIAREKRAKALDDARHEPFDEWLRRTAQPHPGATP